MNNFRTDAMRKLFVKLYPSEKNYKETGEYSAMSDLDYGAEKITFHGLVAQISQDNIKINREDKQLIDEIGESIWNDGPYLKYRMETKYWEDIVSQY